MATEYEKRKQEAQARSAASANETQGYRKRAGDVVGNLLTSFHNSGPQTGNAQVIGQPPAAAPVANLVGTPKTAIGPDIKPIASAPPARPLGQPIIQPAAGHAPAAVAPQAQKPFSYTKGGVTVTANDKERIFTMGTPGQDGSARATMALKQPASTQARQSLPVSQFHRRLPQSLRQMKRGR
jgi:hypothetical protein